MRKNHILQNVKNSHFWPFLKMVKTINFIKSIKNKKFFYKNFQKKVQKSDFFSKSGKTRFLKKGGVPPVGSVRGGSPPKSAALSSVWIGANYVKSDMVPIRNTTRKKKSEFGRGGINSDFSTTFDHFRHDFNDFRKKWNFEKSEKSAFSCFFIKKFL